MSYVIARTEKGVYFVVREETHGEAIIHDQVVNEGRVPRYEFEYEAEKACKEMNRERLERYRQFKKSQGEALRGGMMGREVERAAERLRTVMRDAEPCKDEYDPDDMPECPAAGLITAADELLDEMRRAGMLKA